MMKRVDVVSDNETMLRMLRAGLMLEDYDVHAIMINDYCFPQEEHIPDLLIVDVFLHAEQGVQLCWKWNNREHAKRIPLLFLSDAIHNRKASDTTLATDVLFKPFPMSDLFSMVTQYLSIGSL